MTMTLQLAQVNIEHGPTPFAFTFRVTFPADPAAVEAVDWSAFEPCPATSGS